MSFTSLRSSVSNASPPETAAPGTKAIGGSDECAHPRDALELTSTNGLTYYYQCTQCDGIVVVWRR